MELLNFFVSWVISKRMAQIEHFMLHPHQTQQTILEDLLKQGRLTEWGKKYGYNEIRT